MGIYDALFHNVFHPIARNWQKLLDSVDRKEDPDHILSYYTRQQVKFLDWKLGLTYWSIQVSLAMIIVFYVFLYSEGFLRVEQAKGATVTHVSGDTVAARTGKEGFRYFSTEDITYPGMANGAVFIATKQTTHRQMQGYCSDPDSPCISDADCPGLGDKNATCNSDGLCRSFSWCDVDGEDAYELKTRDFQIWARSFIQFLKIDPNTVLSTDIEGDDGPAPNTVLTVNELLSLNSPSPVKFEEIAQLGGIFDVEMRWLCNLDMVHSKRGKERCKPRIEVTRRDTIFDPDNIGHSFKYVEYIDDDHRLEHEVTGIRFQFSTTGVGKRFSVAVTITTISTSGTLMSLAIVITDLILTKVAHDRARFNARKFEKSPDFSRYMENKTLRDEAKVKFVDIEAAEAEVAHKEKMWLKRFQEK